jgi:transposase-like protein
MYGEKMSRNPFRRIKNYQSKNFRPFYARILQEIEKGLVTSCPKSLELSEIEQILATTRGIERLCLEMQKHKLEGVVKQEQAEKVE